ncbi:MAG: serine hydrolase domain-containing protein [Gemmatimonadales bacterium]|nr:serine hydrolase domain-containing protein [Gemmatimonadales bacterium]
MRHAHRLRSCHLPLLLAVVACGEGEPARARAIPDPSAIDSAAMALMARDSVQGMALAVIEDGQIVHVAAHGWRNAARKLPLDTATIMYGASLTKAAVGYLALQLVDEGTLDLDASIATLLPKPLPEYEDFRDLAGDERWRALTPRILLNHASGFANFRWLEPDQRLRFHFAPGSRYAYSGEGFYILQLVLEEGLGLDVGRAMQERLFDRFDMPRTAMQWRPDFADNLADGHALDGSMEPHDERSRVSAAGSMDTGIADQARFWAAVVRGEALSPTSRAEFVRPQLAITSRQQFPTLFAARGSWDSTVGLSAGLGVVTFRDRSGPAWFKGGHNDWTGNMVLCLESGRRCVVLLGNDVRAERIYPELVEFILGPTQMPWGWEYGVP